VQVVKLKLSVKPQVSAHRDPGADARMKKFESSLRKAMAKPVKKKTAAKKKK
jgi:hypothetical protein